MSVRARDEDGFGLVELLMAMVIVSVALLALMAAYDQAFFSLHSSAKTSSAALLANNQLELYGSLPYASIGLDASTLASVKASDTVYTADESSLSGTAGTDVTISGCGASPQCLPVQTLTGSDGKSYRLETFVRDVTVSSVTERVVTVIARAASVAGSPQIVTLSTAFDQGVRS